MSTLVSGGRVASAITSQLSKPTTATSSGTAMPRSRSASTTPRAIWSLPQKSASARRAGVGEESLRTASRPQASDQWPVGQVARAAGEPAPRPAPCASRRAQPNRLEPFGAGDMGDPAAAQSGEMADREPRAALVVGQQAKRVRGRRPARRRRSPAGRARHGSIGARRSARRAVTTRPSTRLPSS